MRDGTRIWIITEADRSVTTILLPECGSHSKATSSGGPIEGPDLPTVFDCAASDTANKSLTFP